MPKSNFSQYVDECDYDYDYFTTIGKPNKVSFENNESSEVKVTNETLNLNKSKDTELNVSYKPPPPPPLITSSNAKDLSNGSNIFLSKNANNSIRRSDDKYDSFSNKNIFKKTNTGEMNANANTNANANANANANVVNCLASSVIEINDDTFPCLVSNKLSTVKSKNNNNSESNNSIQYLKQNKNFKDAICVAAPVSVTPVSACASSTIKRAHTHVQLCHFPPPFLVKKDSEMFAKKILINTKGDYESENENDNENDDECEYRNNYDDDDY
jgi:hypothetical protein